MSTVIPESQERVPQHTAQASQQRIEEESRESIDCELASDRQRLTERIEELDHEWDIERALQLNMGVVMLGSLGLAYAHDRRWLAMTGAVAGFFLLHALQGWCPPVLPMRRAGVRTAREIAEERTALRILRGDYEHTGDTRR